MTTIFSIGYGNRAPSETVRLVKATGARYLIDVRSSPYSKFSPAYNRDSFELFCRNESIHYLYMGDLLGGRPQSGHCYDSAGKVDYESLESEPYFQDGLKRLKTAFEKEISVVLMCSELRPEQCHRSKLIGTALSKGGIQISHVDWDGSIVSQADVIERLTGGQLYLFGTDSKVNHSRGNYRKVAHG